MSVAPEICVLDTPFDFQPFLLNHHDMAGCTTRAMNLDSKQRKLAHTLLVELLAYQFASPVRWIETQDVILGDVCTNKIVEIGPAPILSGMVKRTIASKYAARDSAHLVRREILNYTKDASAIYYEADHREEEAPKKVSQTKDSPVKSLVLETQTVEVSPSPTKLAITSVTTVPLEVSDVPAPPTDVIRAIVAQKLRMKFEEVPLTSSIKELAKGKSTLQNELVGDLGKEFEALPESPEDIAIQDLGQLIKPSSQLGKVSSMLVSKMMLSKMPPDFNLSATRNYLSSRWGLLSGRQDAVFLDALTTEPATRLAGDDAKAFIDDVVKRYASRAGISLATQAESAPTPSSSVVSSEALAALTRVQNRYLERNLDLIADHLQIDFRGAEADLQKARDNIATLDRQLDLWQDEHGEAYAEGIAPQFDALKSRSYDSWWNWARTEALSLFHDISRLRSKALDEQMLQRCATLANRAFPALLRLMINYAKIHEGSATRPEFPWAKVIELCQQSMAKAPVYVERSGFKAPKTVVTLAGKIVFEEVPRPGEETPAQYVENLLREVPSVSLSLAGPGLIPESGIRKIDMKFDITELSYNTGLDSPPNSDLSSIGTPSESGSLEPLVCLKTQESQTWKYNPGMTRIYLNALHQSATSGTSFEGLRALITGAGEGSIGCEILKRLLQGGANVVVTTSRVSPKAFQTYQDIYTKYGGRGSRLVIVPFNQGSKKDVKALIDYIFAENGLGWDLDFIIPFAAISVGGNDVTNIDSRSEFAHRLMMTNLLRLLGCVMEQKKTRGYDTNPSHVLLPLSPNHGTFGNDGLYSESKISLEAAFSKWESESWANYLGICGAVIGWTRGTGLMNVNNTIAQAVEKEGMRTFSTAEMAFHLLGLLSPSVRDMCTEKPVFADLSGGLMSMSNLSECTVRARTELALESESRKALYNEQRSPSESSRQEQNVIPPQPNFDIAFPTLPAYEDEISSLNKDLLGMVDLERVAVVTGYAEISPWGNARTRWEMEAHGTFSLEGCIEMTWIMGLIKSYNGIIDGKHYVGWVDAATGSPLSSDEIRKYEPRILEHSGIRIMEPETLCGYDPEKRTFLQEIAVNEDLAPFEASQSTAESFKLKHGDKVTISQLGPDRFSVRILKGTTLMIPKAMPEDRFVAGILPTGWDPARYGIRQDIVDQVDPITLYVLICVSEALIQAGITDPYEVYQHIHLSELGNCIGSGAGGNLSLKKIYKDRYADNAVQGDILQESFINTPAAWVNMLLFSSTGPIKTPVGACATAAESLDTGCELIAAGKAKMVIVGATEGYQPEIGSEFANMNATNNSKEDIAKGRIPGDMSRPTTTSRAGFVESHGAGVQVLMSAKLALEMGVPIYGIIALATMASDKIGRSVPAPGQGVLSGARELQSSSPPLLLDLSYRKQELSAALMQISLWKQDQLSRLIRHPERIAGEFHTLKDRIDQEAQRREKHALGAWGMDFWKENTEIAPLRGALATWGLTIDDLSVASLHGTSTVANDKNECDVINKQMTHLGRTTGNPLLIICQKYLTGHPKGPAAAWMLNGCLQVMKTNIVPGNRNADNIDPHFQKFEHLVFPNRSIQTDEVKAFSVTSFGFGQKGAQIIGVNPKYLYATLDKDTYNAYKSKVESRKEKAAQRLHSAFVDNSFFVAKDHPPFDPEHESQVYLNPTFRAIPDPTSKSYKFMPTSGDKTALPTPPRPAVEQRRPTPVSEPHKSPQEDDGVQNLHEMTAKLLDGKAKRTSIGVDMAMIDTIPIDNPIFISRNFTLPEQKRASKSLRGLNAAYAGLWCAKEAVFKSLGIAGHGAGAALIDIEICNDANGKPFVQLHGDLAGDQGRNIELSISYTDGQVVAVAVADVI